MRRSVTRPARHRLLPLPLPPRPQISPRVAIISAAPTVCCPSAVSLPVTAHIPPTLLTASCGARSLSRAPRRTQVLEQP